MTNLSSKIKTMVIAALLSAIGISIPLFSPFKLIIEPVASYTLASHVPVIIAMFISPMAAAFVSIIVSLGFLSYGPAVVLRALSHIIFATLGAYILKKNKNTLLSLKTMIPFALLISVVHALAEVAVSSIFFTGSTLNTFLFNVLLLVGLGTTIHSLVDFSIAILIWKPLQHVVSIPANAKVRTSAK
jgi:niacin transporter